MHGALLALLLVSAPPTVGYVVSIETKTWEPIDLKDVERFLNAAATVPIASSGALKLAPSTFGELKNSDYTLLIQGRFIEEAEKFSVYLTFGPGKRSDLPSLHVSNTASIGQRPRTEMQRLMEELAAGAAKRLFAVLEPLLHDVQASAAPAPVGAAPLPWDWGTIEIPDVKKPTALVAKLLDVRHKDYERLTAMREIAGHAFDQPVARQALELCMLRDPLPEARQRCAEALEPVARNRSETQRLFLYAMRNEFDANVLKAENKIAGSFVGLARKETLETWLELVSSDATPADAADDVAQLLAKEGEVPNLDLAVARCLQQESLAWGKKHACAQWLLGHVPEARRKAVVWRYLESIGVGTAGDSLTFDEITDHLYRGRDRMDAKAAELFLTLAERHAAWTVRKKAIALAGNNPKPTREFALRLLALVRDPDMSGWAVRAISEVGGRDPEIKQVLLAGLKKTAAEWHCVLCGHRGEPDREIADAIKRLEYRKN
ncbi:MAG: hypothetical protein HY903_06875 [Deltaproteobacteria bacterium]|nr:hypothetical protein [Deltaproteobacteria bacterium]